VFEPNNDAKRLREMAQDLVRLKVDVILASGTLGPLAAKHATTSIPIVMINAGDPVGSGLVTNLARPEANVTGLSLMAPDLGGKRLEMFKELLPGLSRVGILWNNANPYSKLVHHEAQRAAQVLGVDVYSLEASTPVDLAPLLERAQREGLSAIVTVEDPLTFSAREQIVAFANSARIPAVYGLRELVEAGGLISYGADITDLMRRAAGYVRQTSSRCKAYRSSRSTTDEI
jgi:putative tryptophan/tyrosine transport system substrate-binding protein